MAKSPKQKQKLLYVMKYLMEHTDAEHEVRTPDIIAHLERNGIHAERKSIYDDMNTLEDFGLDVVRTEGPRGGYSIGTREFELAEVKILVDLVQSSKFVSVNKSRELIKKLEKLVSNHDAKKLQRQVEVADRVKTENESIYYNVDWIHTAIANNKKIRFKYFDWAVDKSMQYRKDGAAYEVSPWLLTWNEENYYLVAYSKKDAAIRYYRVDKMNKIEVLEEEREGRQVFEQKEKSAYAKNSFGMFAGAAKTVQLICDKKLVGVMIDRFGKSVSIREISEEKVKVRINVDVSPHFYGWLTSFGSQVKLVEPAEIVEDYRTYLRGIWEEYTPEEKGR